MNIKDIINNALLRTFLGEVRKYVSAFVKTYVSSRLSTAERLHVLTMGDSLAAVTASPYYASRWVGSHGDITELHTGLTVVVKVPVAGNGTYGTLLNVNGLGEHPVCANVSTMVSTRYSVGCMLILTYDAEQSATAYLGSSSATTIAGVWKIADYDSTIIYQLGHRFGTYTPTVTLYRYKLLLQKKDGQSLVPVNSANNTTATTKVMTKEAFNPYGQILYYGTTTTVNAGAAISGENLKQQYLIDMRHSFNVTSVVANKDVFLVAVPQADGMAVLDGGTALTQELPTSDDGKIYIYLGHGYGTYQMELHATHPVYVFRNGAVRLWNPQCDSKAEADDVAASRQAGYVRPEWWKTSQQEEWTQAFQSALNALKETGGGTVVLTAGKTYTFTGQLTTAAPVVIEGNGAVIESKSNRWLTANHAVTLRSVTLSDTGKPAGTPSFIYVSAADVDIRLEDVSALSPHDNGLSVVYAYIAHHVALRRCTMALSGEASSVRAFVYYRTASGEDALLAEDCRATADTYQSNQRFLNLTVGATQTMNVAVRRCMVSNMQTMLASGGSGATACAFDISFEGCTFTETSYVQAWASEASGNASRSLRLVFDGCRFDCQGTRGSSAHLQQLGFTSYDITLRRCSGRMGSYLLSAIEGTFAPQARITVSGCDLSASAFCRYTDAAPPTLDGGMTVTIENSRLTFRNGYYIVGTDIRLRDSVFDTSATAAAAKQLLLKATGGWGRVAASNVVVDGTRPADYWRVGDLLYTVQTSITNEAVAPPVS